mgnify:CR=1 FL=1
MRRLTMEDYVERGKRYKVIRDSSNFFSTGDIVVALETSQVPYCVLEKDYFDGAIINDYDISNCRALLNTELMEV